MKDFYKILNIDKSSNTNDIKKAYKKLAFQYHPDKNKSKEAESKFRDISFLGYSPLFFKSISPFSITHL